MHTGTHRDCGSMHRDRTSWCPRAERKYMRTPIPNAKATSNWLPLPNINLLFYSVVSLEKKNTQGYMLSSRLVNYQLKIDSMSYSELHCLIILLLDILLFTLNVIDCTILSSFVFTGTPVSLGLYVSHDFDWLFLFFVSLYFPLPLCLLCFITFYFALSLFLRCLLIF